MTRAVLLSLLAAASYGLADFNGGWVAKRVSAWTVALAAQAGGALATVLIALVVGGRPVRARTWRGRCWPGLGNGLGTAFLYRGLASGRMGVVAPVSAIGAVLVPVVVGLLLG